MQRNFIDESAAPEAQKRIEHQKLNALLGLCETAACRRQVLLDYFGDTCPPCGNCDTCLAPPQTFDGTLAAQKALSVVYRTDQRFGVAYLTSVLLGAEDDARIQRLGHDRLSTYGIGREFSKAEWQSVFRQLVALNLLTVDAAHGGLRITPQGQAFLREKKTISLRRHETARSRKAKSAPRGGGIGVDVDPALLAALKAARMTLARAQGVPPYVIFHDKTLYDLAETKPQTLEQMAYVHGIGEQKLAKYGQAFLDMILTAE